MKLGQTILVRNSDTSQVVGFITKIHEGGTPTVDAVTLEGSPTALNPVLNFRIGITRGENIGEWLEA